MSTHIRLPASHTDVPLVLLGIGAGPNRNGCSAAKAAEFTWSTGDTAIGVIRRFAGGAFEFIMSTAPNTQQNRHIVTS